MPASIIIPPHYWASEVLIDVCLVTAENVPYVAATPSNAKLIAGRHSFTVDPISGYTLDLPCNDEVPLPPKSSASSRWLICVHHFRRPVCYRVAIHSSSPPTDWNELIGAAEQVDASHIFTARLLPLDAVQGQFVAKDAGDGWTAVDPPAGTGDMIGPTSATDGHLVVFSGPSGKLTRDGGQIPPGGTDIHSGLGGLDQDDHLHYHTDARGDARYELQDPTLLRTTDIDDVPADGVTDAPISSNWAFDHAALSQAHGISPFGAILIGAADAGAARSVLGAQEEITDIVAAAGF